jgi:MFS transporter, SP family, solute carrier family 2 (myo-inositol transporter), member 13
VSCSSIHSSQDEKAKAIAVLEKIYDSDRLEEEVELLASSSMNEFQSDNTGSYLDVFKSKELRLAFFTGAGLQVCSASFLPYYSRFLLSCR